MQWFNKLDEDKKLFLSGVGAILLGGLIMILHHYEISVFRRESKLIAAWILLVLGVILLILGIMLRRDR